MLGQTIPSGTGFTEILLDEEELINNLQSLQSIEEEQVNHNDYDVDHLLTVEEEEKDECSTDEFKFSFE